MLRNLGRVLRAAHKESTFIPGYPVVINAREVLTGLYRKTLDELQALPADTSMSTHLHTACYSRCRTLSVMLIPMC